MLPSRILYLIFVLLNLIFFFEPHIASASNPTHGARAAGMGNIMTAIADDPSAVAFNPAGLINLKGANFYGGVTAMALTTTFEDPEGRTEETRSQIFFPPHLYFSSDLGTENMAVGLGIFSPFGIGGRKWPDDGITRYISIDRQIATINVNPTIAFRPAAGLSIGAGVDYIYAITQSKKK